MHKTETLARKIFTLAIWTMVALVDITGNPDTNPPPEPPIAGKELWEL